MRSKAWPKGTILSLGLLRITMNWVNSDQHCLLHYLFATEHPQRVLAQLHRTDNLCFDAAWDLPIHLVVSESNDQTL